jgi:hypothetical protein
MKRFGAQIMSSVLVGEIVVVFVDGHRTAFRVDDRLLMCPTCGNYSQPPSNCCYGCESGQPLSDPLGDSRFGNRLR